MIHFVQGKPGGGKTMYAVRKIVEELVFGKRRVETNVALDLAGLNAYIQFRYPWASVNIFERIRILTLDELKTFWEYRCPVGEDWRTWSVGTFIVLDEVHLYFNARKWAETGEMCLWYLSQHRKLGDDVMCVTQHPDNVDKQFRSVAEDFSVIKNGYTRKVGWFRAIPRFTRTTYPMQPTGLKSEPDEVAHFTMDVKGIGSCYKTAAGVGVLGKDADTKKVKKGLHPVWFVVGAAVATAIVILVLRWGMHKGIATVTSKEGGQKVVGQVASLSSPVASVSVPAPSGAEKKPFDAGLVILADESPSKAVWVRGYVQRGRQINVVLSDGRTLTEKDGLMAVRERNFVEFKNGQRIWFENRRFESKIAKAREDPVPADPPEVSPPPIAETTQKPPVYVAPPRTQPRAEPSFSPTRQTTVPRGTKAPPRTFPRIGN